MKIGTRFARLAAGLTLALWTGLIAAQAQAPNGDMAPAWSPATGNRIAYESDHDGDTEIYLVNLDRGTAEPLTDNAASDLAPSWSPDGTRIAFYSSRDGNFEIYVMNANGLNLRRLTQNSAIDWHPSWSPDGRMLVFEYWRDGQADLYAIDLEANTLTRLTQTPQRESEPVWSRHGIAFGSLRGGEWGIYVLDPDSGEVRPLVTGLGIEPKPAWSPDGEWLAYTALWQGSTDIHLVDRQGEVRQALTRDAYRDDGATWSADGTRIAFSSQRQDRWRIMIREVTLP